MKKIVVLGGAGAMGNMIIRDLVEFSSADQVEIADFDLEKANGLKRSLNDERLSAVFADMNDEQSLAKALEKATVLVNATPYYKNVEVMKAALKAGCNYIDLGGLFHVTKKQLELHDEFSKAGLIAILGMGAAPGITNLMAAAATQELERVEAIDIICGSVDFTKTSHPFLPPYALDTLLDEYQKEPMVYEDSEYQAKPAMSGEIEVDLPMPVGKVHAIYTLHSEVLTLATSYSLKGVQRVTFRLGLPVDFHNKLKFLAELGFAETGCITAPSGDAFVPRRVLAEMIRRIPAETGNVDDCEVIRVDASGSLAGTPKLIRHESIIHSDKKTNISCGAIDTGVPPAIVADMLIKHEIESKGVHAPENCVSHTDLFERLAKRNVFVTKQEISRPVAAPV